MRARFPMTVGLAATDTMTGDVYYFEEVDNTRGRIVDHDSAWRARRARASA